MAAASSDPAAPPDLPLADLPLEQVEPAALEQYIEQQVARAVRELPDGLSDEELRFVARCLRNELENDPTLMEWVRRASRGE